MDARSFRQLAGRYATGVTVVSTEDKERNPYGVTVNSFTSVSLDPLTVLCCLHSKLGGLSSFLESQRFAVSILSDAQRDISNHFATPGTDRSLYLTRKGTTGIPCVPDSLGWLECEITQTVEAGDHLILLGEVLAGRLGDAVQPLIYFAGAYAGLNADVSV